ncbi:MAG: WD40 repeat domain-containing protein [Acidimicrobiia bacterium]|nr:WD40 repeat domain-containing protein [Acidimicrobiia bacterium]
MSTTRSLELTPRWSTAFEDYLTVARFGPDGSRLAAGSLSGEAALLDAETGHRSALAPHEMGVLDLSWSGDGHLAVGGQDNTVRLYAAGSLQPVTLELDRWVTSVAWSPSAPQVAVAYGRSLGVARVDGSSALSFDDHPSTVEAVGWSIDGTRVGAACYGGLHWYQPAEPEATGRVFAWKGSMLSLDVAPGGRWVASGCQDASVHVWRLWSGEDLQMAGYPTKITELAWDPTGRYLAVANPDEITLWDFAGKGPQGTTPLTLAGHEGSIHCLAYCPRTGLLASGGADGLVAVWQPPKRSGPVAAFDHDAEVVSLQWHPDGGALVTGCADGTVRVLDATAH